MRCSAGSLAISVAGYGGARNGRHRGPGSAVAGTRRRWCHWYGERRPARGAFHFAALHLAAGVKRCVCNAATSKAAATAAGATERGIMRRGGVARRGNLRFTF